MIIIFPMSKTYFFLKTQTYTFFVDEGSTQEKGTVGCQLTLGAPILRFQRRSSSGPPKQDPGWAGPGKLLLQFFFLFFIISF
jgi:hypothetical protein